MKLKKKSTKKSKPGKIAKSHNSCCANRIANKSQNKKDDKG
jgi:hypothetical protein